MVRGLRMFLFLSGLLLVAVALAACGGPPVPPSKLGPPPARCMVSPASLPVSAPGDNLIEKHGQLRRQYAREASKLRCAQGYIRTVRGK